MSIINRLVSLEIISQFEYDAYVFFEANETGRECLKKMLEQIVLEPSTFCKRDSFAWHDGRRSVWRDIKLAIKKVNYEIEEFSHDHRNKD